eukprot:198219_1
MLYATIQFVSTTVFFLLTIQRLYGTYIEPNITAYHDVDCGNAPHDICTITCNLTIAGKWESPSRFPNVYCGNTSKCIIHCIAESCFRDSIIHANHTAHLDIISRGGKSCLQDAFLHLPNYGNATISGDSNGVTGHALKGLIIHSGTHTKHIDIQCTDTAGEVTKNDCNNMQIHAQNAQYLQMTINGASADNTIIYCPTNGGSSPSCVINARNAFSSQNIQIYAPRGTPQDVLFNTDASRRIYTDTTIICLDGTVNGTIINTTFIGTPCYLTLSPTTQPTIYPTLHPTKYPSIYPSISPSISPSIDPTQSPSIHPISPTSAPTTPPIHAASNPTLVISVHDHTGTTIMVDTPANNDSDDDEQKGLAKWLPTGLSLEIALFIVITVLVLLGVFIIGFCFAKRKNKKRVEIMKKRHRGDTDPKETAAQVIMAAERNRKSNHQRKGTNNIVETPGFAPETPGMETPGMDYGTPVGMVKSRPQSIALAQPKESIGEGKSVGVSNAVGLRPRNIIEQLSATDDIHGPNGARSRFRRGESEALSERTEDVVSSNGTDSELMYEQNNDYNIREIHRKTNAGLDGEAAPEEHKEEHKEEEEDCMDSQDRRDKILDLVLGTMPARDMDDLLIGTEVGSL